MEERNYRDYPIRNFLIKVILVIIFVLLLIWLLPTPKVDLGQSMKGIGDRIFQANVDSMKNAGLHYFTIERLPKEVGDTKKLTLREMQEKKLVLPITDKDGDQCDLDASYIELEKKSTEYVLKVNLKCKDKEDYILLPVGCYDYCPGGGICQKEIIYKDRPYKVPPIKPSTPKETIITGPACELYVTSGRVGENGWFVSDVTVAFKYKTTSQKGAKIKAYGLTEQTTPVYNGKNSYKITKEGKTKVYGYVKDTNNKTAICTIVVKKDTVKPDCEVGITDGIMKDGYFIGDVEVSFLSRLDKTSGVARYGLAESRRPIYNSKKKLVVKSTGEHNVYGYVKDKAGHVRICKTNFRNRKPNIPDDPEDKISKPSCELLISEGKMGNNNWYRSDVKVSFKNMKTTNGAKIVEYGLGNKKNYNMKKSIYARRDGYYVAKGYVKDSYGNEAICSIKFKRDATKPTCDLAVESGTYKDGYYTSDVTVGFNSRKDNLSGINYYGIGKTKNYNMKEKYYITNDGTHVIYGYVEDKAGNENLCSIKVIKKKPQYEYQYKKHFEREYSKWTKWTEKKYDPKNPPKFRKTDLAEVIDLGYKEVTKYKEEKNKPIYQYQNKPYKTVEERTCNGFKYYRNKTTKTTVSTKIISQTTQTITTVTTKTTKSYVVKEGSAGGETYQGLVSLSNTPTNTLSTRYEFVGMDWGRCGSDCTTTPYSIWKKYTRNVGTSSRTETVTETSTKDQYGQPTTNVISSETQTSTSVSYGGVTVKCNLVTKPTQLFIKQIALVGFDTKRVPYTVREYRYRYRSRKLKKEAYDDYKWSYYNDKTLINAGYVMTGNKRIA